MGASDRHGLEWNPSFLIRVILAMAAELPTLTEDTFTHVTLLLLDMWKAYPRVPAAPVPEVLQRAGMPDHMVQLLVDIHRNTSYKLRSKEGLFRAVSSWTMGSVKAGPVHPFVSTSTTQV